MGVQFQVDLDECIARMTRFRTRLERQVAHLDDVVADLHVTWIGDAATAQRWPALRPA